MSACAIAVIGTPADARGFRLAGVVSYPCTTRRDAEDAIRSWPAAGASRPGLLLVSASLDALAPGLFETLDIPIVVVLPEEDAE